MLFLGGRKNDGSIFLFLGHSHVVMRKTLLLTTCCLLLSQMFAAAQADLGRTLGGVYQQWRQAFVKKDYRTWSAVTAEHRQIAVRNRIYSERRAFPASIFDVPVMPPGLGGLKLLRAEAKGTAAKAVFFGKVDFGVPGRAPTDNMLVLNFVNSRGGWKYDEAEYVNLSALPEVRKQLLAGDLSYVKSPEFGPSATPPANQIPLKGPVKYIAKVYVYAPGREVEVAVNKISRHKFQNTKAAEIVIGGALDGRNEVQFGVKKLPGGTGQEPMTVRVYLMSEVRGVKPIKIFERLVPEGGKVERYTTQYFTLGAKEAAALQGR